MRLRFPKKFIVGYSLTCSVFVKTEDNELIMQAIIQCTSSLNFYLLILYKNLFNFRLIISMMKSLMPLYNKQRTLGAEHQTLKLALIILVRYPIDRATLATELLMPYSDHRNNKTVYCCFSPMNGKMILPAICYCLSMHGNY